MKFSGTIFAFPLLTIATFGLLSQASMADGPDLERAIAELRASEAEWRRERDLYRAQRDAGTIRGADAAEYAEFVASLQRQKLENCEAVRRIGGNEALEGTDCLILAASSSERLQQAALPEPAATEEERAGSLEQQLKTLEAELDNELADAQRREQTRSSQRVVSLPGQGASSGANAGSRSGTRGQAQEGGTPKWSDPGKEQDGKTPDPGNENATEGKSGAEQAENKSSASRREGTRDPGAGTKGEEKKEAAKTDNTAGEGGDDDDVVLRQIREAAEKETDPVLKEKLWEEYRKMKAARS